LSQTGAVVGYSEDLAIEKRPKMRCNWASKSPSYFLPVPKELPFSFALAKAMCLSDARSLLDKDSLMPQSPAAMGKWKHGWVGKYGL